MSKIIIEIEPFKKEISIGIPKEIRKVLNQDNIDEMNLKLFGISAMLSDVVKINNK